MCLAQESGIQPKNHILNSSQSLVLNAKSQLYDILQKPQAGASVLGITLCVGYVFTRCMNECWR